MITKFGMCSILLLAIYLQQMQFLCPFGSIIQPNQMSDFKMNISYYFLLSRSQKTTIFISEIQTVGEVENSNLESCILQFELYICQILYV